MNETHTTIGVAVCAVMLAGYYALAWIFRGKDEP